MMIRIRIVSEMRDIIMLLTLSSDSISALILRICSDMAAREEDMRGAGVEGVETEVLESEVCVGV